MRRGFIIPIIILLALSGGGYYFFSKYSKSPNQKTQETANSIYQYPNSTGWQIKPRRNVCLAPKSTCAQPVDIILTANDAWPTIYNYYKLYLIDYGWQTKSTIYTSVPTSIVFESEICQLTLEPAKPFSFLSDKTPSPPYKYVFTVVCK